MDSLVVLKPRSNYSVKSTPVGSKFMYRAKLSIDKETGEKIAEVGEKVDLNAMIQSYKDSCDIATIIARYNAGDESVLNVHPFGFEGDLSVLPKDINDITGVDGIFEKASENFAQLPSEVRALFDNSPAKFFNAILDNSVGKILEGASKPKADDDGVIEEEEKGKEE